MYYRCVETESVVNNFFKVVMRNIFAKEGFCNLKRNLLECKILNVLEKFCRQSVYLVGHKETFVGCKSFDDCLFE